MRLIQFKRQSPAIAETLKHCDESRHKVEFCCERLTWLTSALSIVATAIKREEPFF